MQLRYYLELVAQRIADFCFMLIPRRRPSARALQRCRIISHRGEHDNRQVLENTIDAFRAAAAGGTWGIEFDVRWTRDLQPVVIHDTDTRRVFGIDLVVAETDLEQLQREVPGMPTLAEVVQIFGGDMHLMVELKRDGLGADEVKAARLGEIFSVLNAAADYHFLVLEADLLGPAEFAGNAACLLVAELNTGEFSRQVLDREFGGLCAHYLLLSNRQIRLHHSRGQKLGTGFTSSRFGFYREATRGVDWIFTNRALKLEAIRSRASRS